MVRIKFIRREIGSPRVPLSCSDGSRTAERPTFPRSRAFPLVQGITSSKPEVPRWTESLKIEKKKKRIISLSLPGLPNVILYNFPHFLFEHWNLFTSFFFFFFFFFLYFSQFKFQNGIGSHTPISPKWKLVGNIWWFVQTCLIFLSIVVAWFRPY